MKKLKVMALLCAAVGMCWICKPKERKPEFNEIQMRNIEALAGDESGGKPYDCLIRGSIKCPDGDYVKYIIYKHDGETSLY